MNEQHNVNEEKEKFPLEEIKQGLKSKGFQYVMPVGNGSDGRVVQAKKFDEKEKIEYAIKILLDTMNDEKAKYRKRELYALKANKDSHQNIVKYYEYWNTSLNKRQFLFIQMELCRLNLEAFVYKNEMGNAEIIKAQGPPRFYQHAFPQLLKGLYFIHETMGWVHRDLHPSNILIANPNPQRISDIVVKIADFGRAREIRSIFDASASLTDASKLEKLSTEVGNKLFRAPELNTQDYDYKVDLYSAGIVLYFLSCYLEDKEQWKNEIKAFRNGERRSEDLFHQDDKHLVSLIQSLLQEKEKRPTAEEALKTANKLGETKEPVESQILVESKKPVEYTNTGSRAPQVFVKKDGETAAYRFPRKEYTLSSLKAEVEKCTGVKAESQLLRQSTTMPEAKLVNIIPDEIFQNIFDSASIGGKPIHINVSDSTYTVNREEKRFRVKKEGELVWKRCSTKDYTLSSLQAGIESCIGVKAKSQLISQQTSIGLTAINSDSDVQSLFTSPSNEKGQPICVIVSDSNRKEKKFRVKKEGELDWNRCSTKYDTLSSLQAEIQNCINIKPELQVLKQQTTIYGKDREIGITSDGDVKSIFEAGDLVDIIVSKKLSPNKLPANLGNREANNFLLTKIDNLWDSELCSIEDDTLSSLKAKIESCTGVKAHLQILYQETTINKRPCRIAITCDDYVKKMFKAAEKVDIILSQNQLPQSELMFFIKKAGEAALERCLIKTDALNLSSLKEAIESCIEVKTDSQVLCYKTVLSGEIQEINIKSDQLVQCMFLESTEPIVVTVSQKNDASLDMYQ
ncbi:eIF-2-alpha kinase GCN2-like [Paramuricea clavata]|uniref:EIF-2-alpha kinase GCN2-like n=1 Tax=Paramuricea clavata TaxID=317549 RepID=A0A7D9JDF2_PARCT|nr:eIF-2-alpha kinase GCN2-like [Paramuricea clavata]